MRSKEQILEESAAQAAILRNMRLFIMLLVAANLLVFLVLGAAFYARFVKFPDTAFLGTTDAQSVCAPIGLDEPMVADAVARDFAVTAIRDIMTYDWTSWRDQINASTSQNMTLEGRNNYRLSLNDWGIIQDVVRGYQNATAIQRAPAIITRSGVGRPTIASEFPRYEWEITIPMTLVYRSSYDRRTEDRDFYAMVVRTAKSPLNPKGIALGRLTSSQPVDPNIPEAAKSAGLPAGAEGGAR